MNSLYGLPRPERTATIEMKKADVKELAQTAHDLFVKDAYTLIRNFEDFGRKKLLGWNIDDDVLYKHACKITKPIADKVVDIFKEKEPLQRADNELGLQGLFLSSICNQSKKREIVCDNEMQLRYLAYRLPAGKTFINRGKAGDQMGEHAEGMLVNCGETEDWMGYYAKGAVVNYGKANNGLGWGAKDLVINCGKAGKSTGIHAEGAVINYGETGRHMGQVADGMIINCGKAGEMMGENTEGLVIALKDPESFGELSRRKINFPSFDTFNVTEEDCRKMPALSKYFDDLKAVLDEGKKDHKAFSKLPTGRKVTADVKEILKRRFSWQ